MSMEVANTILEQLGGNRFLRMTGAKNLSGTETSLSFKVPCAAQKITHVIVTLTPADTYTMEFLNCRTSPKRLIRDRIAFHEGIYNDMLQGIFTDETGLYTRL